MSLDFSTKPELRGLAQVTTDLPKVAEPLGVAFFKMADERSRPPYQQPSLIPEPYAWPALEQFRLIAGDLVGAVKEAG